jgi:hypothetical protein
MPFHPGSGLGFSFMKEGKWAFTKAFGSLSASANEAMETAVPLRYPNEQSNPS